MALSGGLVNTQTMVFECRQCGQCCEGKGGIVLSDKDLARLAHFLALPDEEVIEKYCELSNGKLKIKTGADGNCVFFSGAESCTIHEVKPDICRAWPFFRGNLEDPVSLAMARDFCPGINPAVSFEEFVTEGIAYLRARNLVASDAGREANALILPTKSIDE